MLFLSPTSFGHDDFGYGSIMLNLDSRGTDMVCLDINYNWFTRSMTFEDLFFNYRPTNILWRTMYNQIYTANGVVSTIDPATEDSSLKYYLAQALSIRAFDYFVLAQMYQQYLMTLEPDAIGSGSGFVLQNVNLRLLRVHHDRDKTAVA